MEREEEEEDVEGGEALFDEMSVPLCVSESVANSRTLTSFTPDPVNPDSHRRSLRCPPHV